MHTAFPRAAASLALAFASMAWARDAVVAPAIGARQQALMATVKSASTAMAGLKAADIVSGGVTAQTLGWTGVFKQGALDELVTPTGKLRYAIAYKQSLAK